MRLRFLCPSTGHKIEIALEADDEKLLLIRKEDLQTPCSFCGGSRKWVFVQLCAARAATRPGTNIMLPSIRLVLAAIFATVVLMMGGFWLISTFQIAKTSAGVPLRGAPPFDPALADGSKRKQIYALIATRRVNEISPLAVDSPSTNTRVTTAARFDDEETVVETAVNNVSAAGVTKLASPFRRH